MAKTVIIIGASSGMGKSIAEHLTKIGYRVYGTTRRLFEGLETFEISNFSYSLISLNTHSTESISKAIKEIIAIEGHIDAMICCAGFGISGAVEETSVEEAKEQFETNFFGNLNLYKNILPYFRAQKHGRIITISSVAGYIPLPYQSMYSASKYSLEAMTEALRMEVHRFGIKVSLVCPGDINTGFTNNRKYTAQSKLESSPYKREFNKAINAMIESEQNGPGPEIVTSVVIKHLNSNNPPVRTTVGMMYKAVYVLKRIMPTKLIHFILKKMY